MRLGAQDGQLGWAARWSLLQRASHTLIRHGTGPTDCGGSLREPQAAEEQAGTNRAREEHVRARLVGVYRNVHAAVVRWNEKRARTGALVLERRRRLRTRPTHDGS